METQTSEQIANHYSAMLDSVRLIHAVIAGDEMKYSTTHQKKDCVDRNVRHLEVMRVKNFWATEDMAPVDGAIVAGKAYLQT